MHKTFSTVAGRTLVAACIAAGLAATTQAGAAPWDRGGEQVQGSGRIVKQVRQVGGFNGLSLGLPGHVELRIGTAEGVTIEADDNLLPLVETVVENGTLKIRPARRNLNLPAKSIRIVVQARSIERLALGGPGTINAEPLRERKLDVELGGSGTIKLQGVESEAMAVSVGGSGDLQAMRGTTGKLTVSIGGSGDVDLGRVRADSAGVTIAGSGAATVWTRNALSATIAGSGDVLYYGDPQVSKSTVGSGSVRRLGAAPK
ncbi:head GIN domain-containing protein [Massilia jejuensis]|uniref:Head GIN domain-containing protein n=1 Tax=Massilia jejuensis TaxID=648894 RepID=A0ABW0PFB8_9BURK